MTGNRKPTWFEEGHPGTFSIGEPCPFCKDVKMAQHPRFNGLVECPRCKAYFAKPGCEE